MNTVYVGSPNADRIDAWGEENLLIIHTEHEITEHQLLRILELEARAKTYHSELCQQFFDAIQHAEPEEVAFDIMLDAAKFVCYEQLLCKHTHEI
jgi:hypothetical protein